MPYGHLLIHKKRIYRFVVLILATLLFWPVGFGAKQTWDMQSNHVADWLPESFAETKQLQWFVEHFGSDELLVVSWDGCTLDDSRLQQFTQQLKQPQAAHDECWFRQVWSGADVLEKLTSEPINLKREDALARMSGWIVGSVDEITCVVGLVSDAGVQNRQAAIEYTRQVADSIEGLSRKELHLAGTTYDTVAINEASKSSLLQLNLWSFGICLIILFSSLKSIKLAWSVFITAVFCEQISMALMYFTGVTMDSVLLLVANLTLVLTIAGGIHLVNYYIEARLASAEHPVNTAVRAALRPTLLAAITTALGMLSLCVSQITPVRNFGLYAALSILIATGVLFTLLPVMLAQFPPRLCDTRLKRGSDCSNWRVIDIVRIVLFAPVNVVVSSCCRIVQSQPFAGAVVRCRWGIVILAIVVLAVGIFGVSHLNTSTRLEDLFHPKAKILQDYTWFEEHVACVTPIEIVLQFSVEDPGDKTTGEQATEFMQRMMLVEKVRFAVLEVPEVDGSITARNFIPPLPSGRGLRQVARRNSQIRMIYTHREELHENGFIREVPGGELWRISLRVKRGREIDYGQLLAAIDQRMASTIEDASEGSKPTFLTVGGVPLIYKAQAQLLTDLIVSFALALVMIAVVMACVLRGPVVGIATMLPNVLPGAITFGTMGWIGCPVEIGAMLTATAAMGIAVDDTLHFISWFRRGAADWQDPVRALSYAYKQCGAAMVQTSLVCSIGLVVFSVSPFMPIQRFAWLMFALLLLALACDLLVLPAVLLTIGKYRPVQVDAKTE